MTQRWRRIGLLAGVVFVINVAGRLVVRIGSIEGADAQDRIALSAFLAIGLAMATFAIVWARRRPLGEVISELSGAGVIGGLLSLLVGPFVGGATPFEAGLNTFLAQAGLYLAYAGGGALVGMLLLIMLGLDYRSRSLARFAEEKLAKPHRPVRR